jgi:hypothetical protein
MSFESAAEPSAPQVRFWPVEDLPALAPDPFLEQVLHEEPVTRSNGL